jgi:hypothetical protein
LRRGQAAPPILDLILRRSAQQTVSKEASSTNERTGILLRDAASPLLRMRK